ncbi:MAG: citrate/2-methylcitrate synthase [Ruminococcaceae bacterium]|nr:citrate/2-methylcitrate synthase [Oscillospiraceae bacterium]
MAFASSLLPSLCEEVRKHDRFSNETYEKYNVKRGLRNADGTGVMAGLTRVCNVHGYVLDEGEKFPVEGRLTYRGQNIEDLVENCMAEKRFGFEEVVWLLLFGSLPTAKQLRDLRDILAEYRELPQYFAEDMIIKAPSPNIMNQLGRSVLALYSYDDKADDLSLQNVLEQELKLIARMPTIMTYAYQVKRRNYDHKSMFFHPVPQNLSVAEAILYSMRPDKSYTAEEAQLLDLCLMLHAEHGGGNNSTFTTRVLSSSGTDTYATISAAIGSLKGHKHGGANIKVMQMLKYLKEGISNWRDEDEVADFLARIIRGEEGDHSGLVYGMGHAVYTLSDPRAVILKKYARDLAEERGFGDEFRLLETVERLTPAVFATVKGSSKAMCANVDMYSGLVYRALGIPSELFTPLFAVARCAGWCAHRTEELYTGSRIMRPAYKSLAKSAEYLPLGEREGSDRT